MPYDTQNVFAKILRGEIACDKLYEDEVALAFQDLHPQAPVHVLVIPKGPFSNYDDFVRTASDSEIAGFNRAVAKVAQKMEVTATGFRLISNNGANAHQEVPHYHVHVLGGGALGPLVVKQK